MNARVRLFARCVKFTLRKIRREKKSRRRKGGGPSHNGPLPKYATDAKHHRGGTQLVANERRVEPKMLTW
jgi:hypothetical protein